MEHRHDRRLVLGRCACAGRGGDPLPGGRASEPGFHHFGTALSRAPAERFPGVRVADIIMSCFRRLEESMRPYSKVAPDWWDYTTLDPEILDDAARLSADDLLRSVASRLQGRLLRHARRLLPCGGAGIHHGLAASDGAMSRRASVGRSGRPSSCRWWRAW